MESKDAIQLKKNLEEILKIVDEYGNQSKQFSETGAALKRTIESINASNKNIAKLYVECNEYLTRAKEVISFQDKIPVDDKKVDSIQSELAEVGPKLDSLNEQIKAFSSSLEGLIGLTEKLQTGRESEILDKISELSEKLDKHISSEDKKEKDFQKSLMKEFDTLLSKKTKEIISTVSKNSQDIDYADILKITAQNQGLNLRVTALEKKIK